MGTTRQVKIDNLVCYYYFYRSSVTYTIEHVHIYSIFVLMIDHFNICVYSFYLINHLQLKSIIVRYLSMNFFEIFVICLWVYHLKHLNGMRFVLLTKFRFKSSFFYQLYETFKLKSDIHVLGYTQITIERYSFKYIHAGNHYNYIKHYINQSSRNSETENELCHALRCYLRYIQKAIAIYDISKFSLVKFAAQIDPILYSLE